MSDPRCTLTLVGSIQRAAQPLLVEAHRVGATGLLHVCRVDEDGRATVELDEAVLDSLCGDERPHVFFRVWGGGVGGAVSSQRCTEKGQLRRKCSPPTWSMSCSPPSPRAPCS